MLRLLDVPHLLSPGERHDVPSSVPGALLVVLAHRQDWVLREALTGIFWPDLGEADAQHNLRVNLHRLRRQLERWGVADLLVAERRRIAVRIGCDVGEFRAALGRGDWAAAVAAHRAPFLSGFALRGFTAFEEWQLAERRAFADAWRGAAVKEAQRLESAGDAAAAARLLEAQLDEDALAEDVVQSMLRVAGAAGRRDAALAAFERFRLRLADGLGLEPLAGTTALARALREHAKATPAAVPAPHARVPRRLAAPPLVGREAELAALAADGPPLTLVVGEPGVGKTHLLLAAQPTAAWLVCRPSADATLQAVVDYIEDMLPALQPLPAFARHRRELARLVPAAADELPPPAPPGHADALLLDACADVIRALDRPIVIDDLHWADDGLVELLPRLVGCGVRVVAAMREQEAPAAVREAIARLDARGRVQRLRLAPLGGDDVRRLVAELSGRRSDGTSFSAWLYRRSGGNPFFAVETLRSLFETERLREADGSWAGDLDALSLDYRELQVPQRVGELIDARLARLTETTRRALTIAAVAGHAEHIESLAAAAGLSEWALAESIGEAQGAGLIVGRAFAHDLVRESIYRSTPEAVRSVVHASLARLGESALAPHRVAEHWWAAGEPEHAVAASLRAAALDRSRGLHEQAARLLDRLAAQAPAGASTADVAAARARTALERGRLDDAAGHAMAALAELASPTTRCQALLVLADVALQRGDGAAAAKYVDGAAESDPEDTNVLVLRSRIVLVSRHPGDQVEAFERRRSALRRRPPDVELVQVLSALGALYDGSGDVQRGLPLHREAWALAQRLGARYAQVGIASNYLWCLSALHLYDEAIAIGEAALALGDYDGSDVLRNNLAWVLWDRGELDRAATHYARLTESADPSLRCVAWSKLAEIHAARGEAAAQRHAVAAMFEAMADTDLYYIHAAAMIAALNYGDADDAARARGYLREQPLDPWIQKRLDESLRAAAQPAEAGPHPGP